jgi:hypothetical protein
MTGDVAPMLKQRHAVAMVTLVKEASAHVLHLQLGFNHQRG